MSASITQQLEDLHKQILELQNVLPDSPFQQELQRMQRDLANLRNNPPIPRPQVTLIQPIPPHLILTPNELAVWNTFIDYHTALLQDAGGGYYLPREEWLQLADVAADMTTALYAGGYAIVPVFNPPTTNGLYGWDGATQGWLPAVGKPTQTSGVLAYDAGSGQWVPASSIIGRTDGSTPSPGQVGEMLGIDKNEAQAVNVPASFDLVDVSVYTTIVQLTLTPGDWDVEGYITWDGRVAGLVGVLGGWGALWIPGTGNTNFAGSAVPLSNFTETAISTFVSRVNITTSTTIAAVTVAVCNTAGDANKIVKSWGAIRARRMS